MPAPIELFDIALDEVSLVDKGDCPEARIVFWKNDGGRVEKARFNELLRARLTDRVLQEIRELAGTLGDAVAATVFNGEGADAVRENLEEFTTAVTAVIDQWASEAGTVEKVATTKRVEANDITSLAFRTMSKVLERRTVQHQSRRESMTTTPIKKKSDAYAEAHQAAARAFPDESNSQVRMHKFMQTEEGREAYAEFAEAAPDPAPAPEQGPVLKGESAIQKATAEARQLMKSNPDRFPSEAAARAHVWRTNPELSEQYQREAHYG